MIGPLPYIGGKNRLAACIIARLPKHTTYVEAFCGGAQVFFHKPPSGVEVLNDLDGELMNFFRVLQCHHDELIRYCRFLLPSRALYQLLARTDPTTLTDIQRAGRYFYLQKNSFGGLVVKQTYHYAVIQRPNFRPERLPEIFAAAHARLQRVQLECLPYEEVLTRYDRPGTLFYLDPPYYGRRLYRYNFTPDQFIELAERLARLKGRFLLSLNDTAEVRRIFSAFHCELVRLAYTAQRQVGGTYPELLISNFQTSPALREGQCLSQGVAARTRTRSDAGKA